MMRGCRLRSIVRYASSGPVSDSPKYIPGWHWLREHGLLEVVGEVGPYGSWCKWQVSEKGKQAMRDALSEYDRHHRTGLVLTHGRANRRDWAKNR